MANKLKQEVIARWRETGAWWEGEPPLEVVQYRDHNGIKRESQRPLALLNPASSQTEFIENKQEDVYLRPRKTRDEKVATACGYAPTDQLYIATATALPYVPLHILSGYSFGRSLLLAKEIPQRLAQLGLPAAAITDHFSLAGAMEFSKECHKQGVKPLVGASLEMAEGGVIVLIAKTKFGYQQLSELITVCHLDEPRLYPLCNWNRLDRFKQDLVFLTGGDRGVINRMIMAGKYEDAKLFLQRAIDLYGIGSVFVEIERSFLPWERQVNRHLIELAQHLEIRAVCGGEVTHALPEDFPAQDILTCSDTLCVVEELIGRKPPRHEGQQPVTSPPRRALNGERYLRSSQQIQLLYGDMPDLMTGSCLVAELCGDNVLPPRTRLPMMTDLNLRSLVWSEASHRYTKMTQGLRRRLEYELERIERLQYTEHFLLMWDVCRFARENRIQHSGRGSVVDSALAFCLGLSRIDGYAHRLHFDRFLPDDGTKRPDIDIDFEARRRNDIRGYITQKYGQENVAMVAAFGAYCTRGIMREAGKALGLSKDVIDFVAKRVHRSVPADQIQSALQKRPELREAGINPARLEWLFRLGALMMDIPRDIRCHSSGIIVSSRPIAETVPVMWSGSPDQNEPDANILVIQWDKRSAKYCFDKFDILCLRGQDVLSGTEERVRLSDPDFNVENVSLDEEDTYRTMRSGHLIGIPQSASPAMRQAHIRLETKNLADASLVQAGIRPGVGGAVKMNELIARRRGLKPWGFDHPDFEPILEHTYGIIVFQEQVDMLLQQFCGYTSGEAEDIRDQIHKKRRQDYGQEIRDELIRRVISRNYSSEVAEKVFDYVAGFKGYGFAQGHALAFAEISIRSIACQQNFPAEYFAALLNAQPAGYYGSCTLVNEARSRGVAILPVCVNSSYLTQEVEDIRSNTDPQILIPHGAIRLGLAQVYGLSSLCQKRIVAQRMTPYLSVFDFAQRTQPSRPELENLILIGGFDCLHPNRRALLWLVPQILEWSKYHETDLDLELVPPSPPTDIEDFSSAEKAIRERTILGLDIQSHLMNFERERISARGGVTTSRAQSLTQGQKAIVVGNPIRLRFPPTPSGKRVVFFDLEDETGLLNVTCFDRVYQQDGQAIVCSPYITVIGCAQWREGHMAFLAQRVFPYDPLISKIVDWTQALPVGAGDFLVG